MYKDETPKNSFLERTIFRLHCKRNEWRKRMFMVRRRGLSYLFLPYHVVKVRYQSIRQKKLYGSGYLTNRNKIKVRLKHREGECCRWCPETNNLTIDHIVEIRNGGSNDLKNLRLLCLNCHTIRNAGLVIENEDYSERRA